MTINRMMEIFKDTNKADIFDKCAGWYWADADEVDNHEAWHGPFARFTEMVADAVEPYMDTPRHAIQNVTQPGLFWSNRFGWTCFDDCDEFESMEFNLPVDGRWVNAADFDSCEAVCEYCGGPAEYDSELCLCQKCEQLA